MGGHILVLDVGKSNSKLSLWDRGGRLLETRMRANAPVAGPDYLELDVAGVETWLAESVAELAARFPIATIVPVEIGRAHV